MKKNIFQFVFLLIFLLVPISVFAEEPLGDFNFNPKESSHPYDIVNSKGEVIKYGDYSKNSINLNNETESFIGTGELNPIFVGDLLKENYVELMPPKLNKDLTYNKITPNVVIGADGRNRVEDTAVFPFSAISYIVLEWADGSRGTCTGTLIGRDRVLTNGHCVVDPKTQKGITRATVYPGVSESTAWFGAYSVIDYFVTSNWINTGSISEDFAVLVLSSNAGERAGFTGIRQVNNLLNQNIGIFGYPGDLINRGESIDQYGMRGNVTNEDGSIAYYTIDTAPGQSGSAFLNTNNQIVGIHSSGYTDLRGNPLYNGGPKMNNFMFQFVTEALN